MESVRRQIVPKSMYARRGRGSFSPAHFGKARRRDFDEDLWGGKEGGINFDSINGRLEPGEKSLPKDRTSNVTLRRMNRLENDKH